MTSSITALTVATSNAIIIIIIIIIISFSLLISVMSQMLRVCQMSKSTKRVANLQ